MIPVESPFPPGLIVIVTSDLSRYPEFSQCLLKLLVPFGTTWQWVSGTSIESNRNIAVNRMRDDAQWVYTIDDDHTFDQDVVMRLLQRMWGDDRISILQGLCVTRKPPYYPFAYRRKPEADQFGIAYESPDWSEIPARGVSEWDACGTGGMLIRRDVFDMMPYPWFESGKTAKDHIGEDLYFCTKAKQLGFRVFVDSDTRTGHITKSTLWAVHTNGEWHVGMEMSKDVRIAVPRESWAKAKFDEIKVPV